MLIYVYHFANALVLLPLVCRLVPLCLRIPFSPKVNRRHSMPSNPSSPDCSFYLASTIRRFLPAGRRPPACIPSPDPDPQLHLRHALAPLPLLPLQRAMPLCFCLLPTGRRSSACVPPSGPNLGKHPWHALAPLSPPCTPVFIRRLARLCLRPPFWPRPSSSWAGRWLQWRRLAFAALPAWLRAVLWTW